MLDRILSGQDEKGRSQFIGLTTSRHGILLHGLQESSLSLWWCAVDFVGQDDVRKDGAVNETKGSFTRSFVVLENLRSSNVCRHEVGSELYTPEFQIEDLGQAVDHQSLC